MKKFICVLAMLVSLFLAESCKKNNTARDIPANPELRISNATPWDLDDCTVDPPGPGVHNYGHVSINSKTGYETFSLLYSYAMIHLTMNNKTYTLQPYDFVGETPLTTGRYTYKLTYSAPNDRLNLELIKD